MLANTYMYLSIHNSDHPSMLAGRESQPYGSLSSRCDRVVGEHADLDPSWSISHSS